MTALQKMRLPTEVEVQQATDSSRTLSAFSGLDRVRLMICHDDDEQRGQELILPGFMVEYMLQVATHLSQGRGVTILPLHTELTTVQAAEILNMSRPHLIKLLEKGELPFHKVGSHRRIYAKDVLAYKDKMLAQRDAALSELTALSQEMGLYND